MKRLLVGTALGSLVLVCVALAITDTGAQQPPSIDLSGRTGVVNTQPPVPGGGTVLAADDRTERAEDFTTHDNVLQSVRQAIADSDEPPFRKWRLLRRLSRQRVAIAVTDYVISEGLAEGYVVMAATPDGGQVMQLDLDGILDFIERLLPIIIQLISLFGGFMIGRGVWESFWFNDRAA